MPLLNLYSVVSDKLVELRRQRVAYLDMGEIASVIINEHGAVFGEDADFYRDIAWGAIRSEVRAQLNKIKIKPELVPDTQLVMPGFERLQEYYALEKGGESLVKRIDLMTIEELESKAAELRVMGKGCYDHAREIETYIRRRKGAA